MNSVLSPCVAGAGVVDDRYYSFHRFFLTIERKKAFAERLQGRSPYAIKLIAYRLHNSAVTSSSNKASLLIASEAETETKLKQYSLRLSIKKLK